MEAARALDDFLSMLSAERNASRHTARSVLSVGLIALPYYRETNPTLSATARRAIGEAVADYIGMSQRD